jgi:transposase
LLNGGHHRRKSRTGLHVGNIVLEESLELSAQWKVALHDGLREKSAVHTVSAPQANLRLQAVLELIAQYRQKWSLPSTNVRVGVSYEAGQDAFWIVRALCSRGIESYMIDAASMPVERHKLRAKTDRLDAVKLVTNLRAWLYGERDRMHVVRVPSVEDEALRHLIRDRGQLHKEVLQHRERMRKLLITMGCWDEVDHQSFARRLTHGELVCHDGTPLPGELRERLMRETARLESPTSNSPERTLEQSPSHPVNRVHDFVPLTR